MLFRNQGVSLKSDIRVVSDVELAIVIYVKSHSFC